MNKNETTSLELCDNIITKVKKWEISWTNIFPAMLYKIHLKIKNVKPIEWFYGKLT